jgi:hypothetical protein
MGWRRRVDEGEQEGQEWRAGRAFGTPGHHVVEIARERDGARKPYMT